MKIGFATADITPPIGSQIPGSFNQRFNTGVHDPLLAKAIVLDDGTTRSAFVGVDCLSLKHSVVQRARERAASHCDFPPENIMMGASHTHSGGPSTAPTLGTDQDNDYLDFMAERLGDAVILADAAREEAVLDIASGYEDRIGYNRRFWMRDGRQTTHPGKGNPEIIGAAGPIDPEVGVLGVWSTTGRFLGCLINYTCHCTVVGGPTVSGDYPYYTDRAIRGAMDQRSVTVFLNGAFGDITQVANTLPREREFGHKWGQRLGYTLAGEVLKTLAWMEPHSELRLQSATRHIELQPRELPRERVAEAEALLDQDGPDDIDRHYAREIVALAALNQREPTVPAEIQALSVNDTALVGIPAEYFCQFGLEIKSRSRFPRTLVAGAANGMVGYVPTRDAMGPQGGGYEPRLCRSSKLAPEAGEIITATAVELLHSLEVPPPKTRTTDLPPTQPWDAGRSKPGS